MNCGFGLKREAPFRVPAGDTVEIVFELQAAGAGPFSALLHVFVDDLGVREIVLYVDGTAKPKP